MTDVQTDEVYLPQTLDADVVFPDGMERVKVRLVYRSATLQGVSMGSMVLGPTVIVEPGVSMDGAVYVVPTPEGVYRVTKRQKGCGCGG
jgi:hypothetical protein